MPKAFDVLRQEVTADAGIYRSPNALSPDEATKKARALRAKIRAGQSVTYVAPDGQTFRAIVKNVSETKVLLKSMSYGPLLVDFIQFEKNDGNGAGQWTVYGQPPVPPTTREVSEVAMHIEEAAEHLKVLKDPKVHKILQNLYTTYVSDQDLAKVPAFLQAVDGVVFEMRDGVPVELQANPVEDDEDDEGETAPNYLPNSEKGDGEDGDDSSTDEEALDDFQKEVNASLTYVHYDERMMHRIKASVSRHLVEQASTSLAHPAVKDFRNTALKLGFRPSRTNPSIRDGAHKHLISLRKEQGDKHVLAEIYHKPETGEYTLAVSHTKRGQTGDALIRPHKKVFPGPKSLRKHGTATLRRYG